MSDVINLNAIPRQARDHRDAIPEGGALILLFTGVQYVRDEKSLKRYQALAMKQAQGNQQPCRSASKRMRTARKTALAN